MLKRYIKVCAYKKYVYVLGLCFQATKKNCIKAMMLCYDKSLKR